MTWQLVPGVGLARRDADHLQLGLDPPRVAVLPDTRSVRRLVLELAHGGVPPTLDALTGPALDELVRARLVRPADDEAVRADRRAGCRVHLDVPDDVLPSALRLAADAGLGLVEDDRSADVAVVWSVGEVARERLDDRVRRDVAHLVVQESFDGPVLGPYVVPGRTACLRCVDAHAGERDPRRALVVEQLAGVPSLRPPEPDPALRALALAWVVRDLAVAAEGGVPTTWSATVRLGTLPPRVASYGRHLHCGCAWADAPDERAG